MTDTSRDAIDRREALRRAAVFLGGAVSPHAAAAVLAGCRAARTSDTAWTPRLLTAAQAELVATIAEHILPETDTPGARTAGVHRFIDTVLAEGYLADQRQRFLAGLADLDRRGFLQSPAAEQRAVLEALDRDAGPFFREMKALVLAGYYTSEIGATRELRHAPLPGRFEGCVPLAQVGRTWAV